jgi:hypothetical protein
MVYIIIRKIIVNEGNTELTPWLMEPEGSMLLSQGLSNNPYPEPK